jgi:hypothetical protein
MAGLGAFLRPIQPFFRGVEEASQKEIMNVITNEVK